MFERFLFLPGYFHYTKWGGPSYLPGRMSCSLFTFTSPSSSFAPCCPSKWSSFPWIRPLFLECVNCVYVCSNLVHHMKESIQYIILIQSYLKHSESSSQLRKESIYEPLSRKNGRVRDRTKEGDSASKHQGHPLLMSEGAWVLGWMTTSWNRAPQKGDINYNRKSS